MDLGNVAGGKLRLEDPTFLDKFATAAMSITVPASIGCTPTLQNGMMGSMMPLVMQNMQAMQKLQAMHIMQVMQKLKDIDEMDTEGHSSKKAKKAKKKSANAQNAVELSGSHVDRMQHMQLIQEQLMQMQSAQTMQCVQNIQAAGNSQALNFHNFADVTQNRLDMANVEEKVQLEKITPEAAPLPLSTAPQFAVPPTVVNHVEAMETISAEDLEKMWEPLPLSSGASTLPIENFAPPIAPSSLFGNTSPTIPIPAAVSLPLGSAALQTAATSPSNETASQNSSVAVAALVAQATAAAVNNINTAKEGAAAAAISPATKPAVLFEQNACPPKERYLPSPIRRSARSRSRKASRRRCSRKSKSKSSKSSGSSRSSSRSNSDRKGRKNRTTSRERDGFSKTQQFEDAAHLPRLPLPQMPPAATVGPVPDWMSDLMRQQQPVAKSGFKALTVMASHVGHLIGPNGSTIMAIRKASGSDIKIDHGRDKAYGTVTIIGNVDVAERLIFEVMATKNLGLNSTSYAVS